MQEKNLTLLEYAALVGKSYRTVWRHYQQGKLICRKDARGRLFVVRCKTIKKPGRPLAHTREKILKRVYDLCKDSYVPASKFPSALYKLCRSSRYGIGSVRAAKWQAKLQHQKRWSYPEFIQAVEQFCKKDYRDAAAWPENLKDMANHYCGSIRKAKWEAGIIQDHRRRQRKNSLKSLWPKEKFLKWVQDYCSQDYRKASQWPGYMRHLAVVYCKTVRGAKWQAGVLTNQRNQLRKRLKIK